MVQLVLPKNSRVGKGRHYPSPTGGETRTFRIYRYDPEAGGQSALGTYEVAADACGPMVLDGADLHQDTHRPDGLPASPAARACAAPAP